MIAAAFPGQGSQAAGMGAGLAAFPALADRARDSLGLDLMPTCVHDPEPAWTAATLQQAIFVTSCAALMAVEPLAFDAVVGHSLGDYTALVAAGALDFEAALRVVDVRGRAMAAAGERSPGGMIAVMGLAAETVEELVGGLDEAWVANVNGAEQVVVSGSLAGIDRADARLREAGARRVWRLPIDIACHTPLMAPASDAVAAALADAGLRRPSVPFYSTLHAQPLTDPAAIAEALVAGVTSPVRFSATAARMVADGVTTFVEVGPGRVLHGLLRRIARGTTLSAISSDEEARDLLAAGVP